MDIWADSGWLAGQYNSLHRLICYSYPWLNSNNNNNNNNIIVIIIIDNNNNKKNNNNEDNANNTDVWYLRLMRKTRGLRQRLGIIANPLVNVSPALGPHHLWCHRHTAALHQRLLLLLFQLSCFFHRLKLLQVINFHLNASWSSSQHDEAVAPKQCMQYTAEWFIAVQSLKHQQQPLQDKEWAYQLQQSSTWDREGLVLWKVATASKTSSATQSAHWTTCRSTVCIHSGGVCVCVCVCVCECICHH